MAKVVRDGTKISWVLDEDEEKVWQQRAYARYSQEDNDALAAETEKQGKAIVDALNSDKYKDRTFRVNLQKQIYAYQGSLARLKNRGYDVSSAIDQTKEIQKASDDQTRFFNQFKTENDYNDYVAWQKDYQEKLSYDTVSAQKELDDLNAVLEQAKQYENEMGRYVSGAGADESLYIGALWSRDSLLKRYGYSTIDEMEKDISGKNQYLTLSKRIQDAEKLRNDAIGASDFKEFSEMGASIENPSLYEGEKFFGPKIGNKVTYSRENLLEIKMGEGNGTTMKGSSIYGYMTEEEVSIYNYYLAKEGEEKADEYLDSIAEELNYREATGIYDRVLEGNTAIEIVFGAMAGLDQAASGFRSLFSGSEDYVPASSTQIAGQMGREDLADAGPNLPKWAGRASLGQLAYDFTSTSANMTPSFLVSALTGSPLLGSITLGASAAGNAYQEKINLGYSKDQARAYAVLVGASEMGLQYLLGGISKLGGKVSNNLVNTLISNVDNAFARTALKLGGNMASEFTEEYLQDVLTPWFENLTLYTDNDVKLYTPEYLYSGLMGALTAGFMEGLTTVAGKVQTYKTGKTIQKSDFSVERLAKLGQTFSADSVAYRLAGKVNENTGAYTIGRLFNEIGATLTEQNQAEITKSLERKGVAHDDAVTISETLAAVVEGRTLSERQAAVLNANDVVSKTVMDVIINPNSTVNQRTQNYNEALMSLAREKAGKKATADTTASAEDVTGEPATPAEGKVTSPVDDVSERVLEASADGKTVRKSSGEEVKIARIASTKDGKMTLKLDTGETVNAEDVSYASEGEALVYETVARLNTNVEAANALVDAYDPSMSAEVYARGIEEAYRYGMYNFSVKEMADKSSFASELTQVQRNTAYKLGQIFGGREVAKQQAIIKKARAGAKAAKAEGKVHFDGDRSTLNERQRTSLTALEKIADALGVQIYVFESEEVNGKRKGANGWFDPKDSSIHIDLYAGQNGEATMLFTAAHELTHFIRKWSPAKFKVLANFLMEQYGKKGVSVDTLVQNQIAKAKKNGRDISYDTAYEEVIADSMETMLSDGKVAEKLALLKAKDKTLWGKIKEFFSDLMAKIHEVYKGMKPNSAEGQYVAEMKDALERIQELFAEGLVEASENFRIGSRNMEDFSAAQNTDGESLFQYRAMEADEDTYRGMLKKWGKLSNSQIENLFTTIDKAMEIIKDNLEALDYAWDADINDRAFSPVKPNSDSLYQVSLDFSTLCRKRILQQTVQAQLQEALNQPLTREEGIAIRDALMAIQKEGRQIEVACALCYVESARMKSPAQIKKFINNRETVLRNYFATKNGGDIKAKIAKAEADVREQLGVGDTSLKNLPGKVANAIRNAKKAAKASYIPTKAEQKLIDVAKGMTVSDFTSPEGLEKLAKNYPDLFDAYTSFIRNATKSKGIENDTWWRAGDSEKIGDVLIANMNRENGLRSQSWSDFQVVHMLDYIAATIELSTRNAKEQAYSKVPDYVELMGQTGVMINMSLIPARDFTGALEYDSVEGIDYKRSLELRDKYHATAGTICIGMDNAQIKMLLADDTIDYVIPYHRSGMAAHVRKAMHIPTWSEYEKYQNETNLSRTEAQSRAEKYGVKLLPESDPNYQKHTSFSEWFDLKEAQQIAKMENSNPSDKTKQKKYGVMYGGYMAMQNAGNNYLKLCAERGLAPKFSYEKADFTGEDNYWKLLIDRKMVDNVTGEIIEQQTIKPIFDEGEVLRILNDELERYPGVKADQDYAVRRVTEKYLSGELKGGMSAEDIAKVMKKPVDNVTKTNILASAEDNGTKPADYDLESEFADAGIKYSERVTDKDTLSFLNSQETITTYKTMQVVDGKLYPPMASRIEGKFEDYSEIGVWEQATEHPELIRENGKFKLDKGKGQGSIEAAYNPYMHSSNLVINDQFSGAYKRTNLVTVECVVPASEATSGYHAQYAKDSVGWKPWHTGTVAGSIRKAKGIERQVFLSRWIKPVRIISDAETASMIKDLLDGTDVSIPDNVVWPTLLDELRNAGVKIEESGRVKYSFRGYAEDGKGIYESNFQKGTPKKAKSEKILSYIQNVWSKKPIRLKIEDSAGTRYIEARFDPTYDESGNIPTDASKIMGGNRHGTSAEQRVTLDLADDYYKIASESSYNYSKDETGKPTYTHKNVKIWHYFINDIYFAEYGSNELSPYRVSINVKETSDGNFFYSFSAEKEKGISSQRTLHAAVNSKDAAKGNPYGEMIPQPDPAVKGSDLDYVTAVRPNGKLGEGDLYQDRSNDFEKVNQVLERENAKLKEDVSYLKEMLKLQKTVTGGTKFTKSSVESAASYLMKYANARGDKAELAKRLTSFYEYIAKGEELTWESVKEEAAPAAEWLMDNLIQGMKVEYIYEEDLLEQDLIGQVYDSYWRVSTLRTVADVKQKEINRLKAHHANRMQELKDAHTESVNKLKQEYKTSIEKLRKDYRNSVEHKQQEIKAAYQESRKKAVEDRRRTAMRHKIKDVVNELNTYLLKGTKDKHVMIGLQKAVASALDAVNMDTVGAEERIAKLNEEITRAKTPEKIKEIMGKIERIQAMGDKMSDRLARLKAAYAEIKDSDDPLIANSHDEVIEAKIEAVTASVGDTALRDMSLSQLEDVYELYKMVLTTIRNANKTFKAEKGKEIAVLGNNVMMEVEEAGGKKKLRIKGLDGVSKFMWNNLKPVYAFKAIGSKTLSKVFDSVRAGEDTWARDVSEAREYYLEKSKKYGYDSWDFEKRYGFKSSSGMDFNLNLEQIMSLYAYSKREQALDHLQRGGFVFDETTEVTVKTKLGIPLTFNPVEATAYNISPETLAKITGKLTKEQKAFVDEMQDYLSTTMGAKGNEVSLEMYGVKLFKEKFYFPLKSATQFMAKAKEQQKGEVKIKNSGFSKETVRKANNPIVLAPFMDVWANHVNEMSMYHAFVLPMEDFYRVFNYKTPTSDTMPTESVEMYIQNAYGKGATAYIEQLLRDLNGGARSDPTAGFINNMMGRFKKGAVFASASVVIQQPSAIARALALVDSKYFVGKKMDSKKHAELWAEVKKYAPVAIIKEMGYFDTNMGKSTADFIKAKEYGSWRDKMTALVKDGGYRDEVLSKAPALADELAWCQIWEAVKRETMDKTSLRPGSEEFMLKAGERFTEVIVNTQVYDSVLSRSANMRSKDTGMKMATAFLAEPTTSINMIADALIQGKRGNVKYARSAIGAVIASQILNSILVSFVYAGRDDDEDETYWEKYLGSLTAEVKDSFNLFGYIPFVKDIVSIMKGYDVERSDISVISDLWKAGKQLSSDNLSVYRKVENFAGSIAQMFGLPVRNIMRDARGLYQTVESFMNGQHTTGAGIKYAVMGAITNKTVSDTQQLYESMLNDDEAHAERVRGRFKDQSAVDSAIRKALRENDPRIHEAAVARNNGDVAEYTRIAKEIIAEGHFSQDLVVTAINAEINKLDQGESENSTSDKQVGMYKADDFAAAVIGGDAAMANAVRTDIIRTKVANGDTQAEAEMSFASSASSSLREEFLEGRISEQNAVQALVDYCGKDQEDAEDLVGDWSFRVKYGFEYSQKDEAYMRGELSATELKSILMETEGMDAEKADAQIQVYDWEADGYEHVTIARVQDYNDHCAALGVPKDIYLEIRYIQSNTENDKDENGKSISYSAVQKIMAEINSYNLTPAQKTAIAESIGWSEKTIRKYKLW